jgi:ketopantoate reductase
MGLNMGVIIGDGALGWSLAALLGEADEKVFVLSKKPRLKTNPVMTLNGSSLESRFIGYESFLNHDFKNDSIYYLCVKVFDLEDALKQLSMSLMAENRSDKPLVIICCNGLIIDEMTKWVDAYDGLTLARGIVTWGSTYKRDQNKIAVVSKQPKMDWGYEVQSPNSHLRGEVEMHSAHAKISFQREINPAIYIKWLYNCTLNTVAARFNCPTNGMVLNYVETLKAIWGESVDWAKSNLLGLQNVDFERQWEGFLLFIEDVYDNRNSMVCDLASDEQSEMQYLAGKLQPADQFPKTKKILESILTRQKK